MNFYGEIPAMYNITVNMENPLVARIMEAKATEVAPAAVIPEAASDASEDIKRTITEAQETAAASHTCMTLRGVQKANAVTTTSAFSGIFLRDERTRNEFLNLIK